MPAILMWEILARGSIIKTNNSFLIQDLAIFDTTEEKWKANFTYDENFSQTSVMRNIFNPISLTIVEIGNEQTYTINFKAD